VHVERFLWNRAKKRVVHNLESTLVKPGKYQIVGVYMPDYGQVHEFIGLPRARGL